ncbi:hypothetical protein PIB30_046817 [Stylosanthes scabra]|uniref:Uncharacterized protein n=1 Tax=Stylosanthes scabra TaxID=79078 RepID=A0ABU6SH30_9FABA|nr:hypothetical protein [Stylosanthes scabra]
MVKENVSKKGKAPRKSSKPAKDGKPKKDQGHEFRCAPKTVVVMFKNCLNENPEKEPWWKKWGTPFPDKVVPKELSEEDHEVYKFFQGKTQAALGKLIMDTPVDTIENNRLFMRAFLLFIRKCFLLSTSFANVMPRAYATLYDVENTKQRNWALHVHNFLLEEIKKAEENNT